MKKVLQLEYRQSILVTRAEILRSENFSVDSILGTDSNWKFQLSKTEVYGVIVVGHGSTWFDRRDLIAFFCATFPNVPVIALLRRSEEPFYDAAYNCPADEPVTWLKTIRKVLTVEAPNIP